MITIIFWFLVLWYLACRLTVGICRSPKCLVGKTALITGGNAGIGYETALNLASRGCRVIIAARNNLEETKNKIIQTTGNANVVCKKLDLSSFKQIRQFADDLNATESKIDILINNSGIPASECEPTEDGHHRVMQVNYLGPFLLTHLLLDKMKQSAPSRIIFTSSMLAYLSSLDLENVKNSTKVSGWWKTPTLYNDTKLSLIMAANGFAKKLKDTGVTANSLHPGWVSTNIFQKWKENETELLPLNFLIRLAGLILFKDPWEGAQTTVHAAVSEELENVTGKFFMDCWQVRQPRRARNLELAEKLWNLSENLVGLLPNEKIKV